MMLRWSSRPWWVVGDWIFPLGVRLTKEKTKRETGKKERLKDLGNVLRK
jgi:hypothetical protein